MEHHFLIDVEAEYFEEILNDEGFPMEHSTFVLFTFKPVNVKKAEFLELSPSRAWFTFDIDNEPLNRDSLETDQKIFYDFAYRCDAPLFSKNQIYVGFDKNQDIEEVIQIFKETLSDYGFN